MWGIVSRWNHLLVSVGLASVGQSQPLRGAAVLAASNFSAFALIQALLRARGIRGRCGCRAGAEAIGISLIARAASLGVLSVVPFLLRMGWQRFQLESLRSFSPSCAQSQP